MEHAEIEHARAHQHQHAAHGRPAQIQNRPPAEAVTQQRGDLDQQVEHRAGDGANGQAAHTHRGGEEERAGDNPERVDDGGEGRQQEVLETVEHASLHGAHAEDHGRDEQQPEQPNSIRLLSRGETGGNEAPDEQRRRQCRERCQQTDDEDDQVGDGSPEPPGRIAPLGSEHLGENGNERRRECAAGYDGEQQIGELEGCVIGVELCSDAESLRNYHVAHDGGGGSQPKGRADDQHIAGQVPAAGGDPGRLRSRHGRSCHYGLSLASAAAAS